MKFQYITYDDIDEEAWDTCMKNAVNGTVYGYSWVLSALAERWDAVVLGDYEAVMPLPWNQKMGVRSIYPPILAQQLGVFSTKQLNQSVFEAFLQEIPKSFHNIILPLNAHNNFVTKGFEKTAYPNYILNLNKEYEVLRKGYNQNTKRNLKKSKQAKLQVMTNIEPIVCVEMFKQHKGNELRLHHRFFENVLKIMYQSIHRGLGQVLGVFDERNQLCAAGFFVSVNNRIYNLFPTTNTYGREHGAMFMLVDHLIQENELTEQVFDFEGSKIEGVARFYKGFGAVKTEYWHIGRTQMPFYLRIPFNIYQKIKSNKG